MTSLKPKGSQQPNDYFTGTVFANIVVTPDDQLNSTVGKVTFEPKARTNWHSHGPGQVLLVTAGVGYYQEKGQAVQIIREGDVVKIPANRVHWHGASHHSAMTHLAIVASAGEDGTTWLQPVTDEEYDTAPAADKAPVSVNITPEANKNHEELWPGFQSEANVTDPELVEVFGNFAYDEVLSHDELPTKSRVLLILASTIGSQAVTEYKMLVEGALNVGVTPVEIKEVLYQSVPYVGVSKAIDFIYLANELFKARGIELPLAGRQSTTTPETRFDKGYAVQKQVVGADALAQMYEKSPKDLLHIQRYLSANCFGDNYTRNGLDLKTRELVTLSFLIALGGTEPQIKGHIGNNARVGNGRQLLIDVITQLLPYVGYPRTLNAITCLNEVLPEK